MAGIDEQNDFGKTFFFLLLLLPFGSGSINRELHPKYAIPNNKVTSNFTGNASMCKCLKMCFSIPNCKAATFTRGTSGPACLWSTLEVEAGDLDSDASAVTFLIYPEGYSCSGSSTLVPGVGCLTFVFTKMQYASARVHCQTALSGDLFTAESPDHFFRMIANFLPAGGQYAGRAPFVGINQNSWLSGRPVSSLEWPTMNTLPCSAVSVNNGKLVSRPCTGPAFVSLCHRKIWS